jgi:hypothetical protein
MDRAEQRPFKSAIACIQHPSGISTTYSSLYRQSRLAKADGDDKLPAPLPCLQDRARWRFFL